MPPYAQCFPDPAKHFAYIFKVQIVFLNEFIVQFYGKKSNEKWLKLRP